MSEMARTDEIDDLVSSVRDFVSHKDSQKLKSAEKLMLTQELRVAQEAEIRIDVEPAEATAPEIAENVVMLDATAPQADREGLEATIAELEAAVTAQADDWEPDEGEGFEEHTAWAVSAFESPPEAADATVEDVSKPEKVDEMAERLDALDMDALETAVAARLTAGLDEKTLRALVVATVHEELSGELGERITRNVRKLVRREINRVLASRELGQS